MGMNTALLEIFRDQAEKLFAFLPSDCGFALPKMAVDEHALLAVLTFKGQNLAIQLLLDVRAQDVDCKVARVSNGKVTEHYGRDEAGKLVRESLFEMLTRKGVRASLFTKVSGMSLEERIPITLEDFSRMLKQHGKDILADSSLVFE
jgi:hypothetical protein